MPLRDAKAIYAAARLEATSIVIFLGVLLLSSMVLSVDVAVTHQIERAASSSLAREYELAAFLILRLQQRVVDKLFERISQS